MIFKMAMYKGEDLSSVIQRLRNNLNKCPEFFFSEMFNQNYKDSHINISSESLRYIRMVRMVYILEQIKINVCSD